MCGVTGIIRWGGKPPQENEVSAMTEAMSHRGPDGRGVYVRDRLALGHRRLSIIDLEYGQQPMQNEAGDVIVTFNGEIYNFRELRDELKAKGHRFKTHSDTEAIVHAYEEWGSDCVSHLRGMFAFGVADWRNCKLFLARDHFGIKPLFYRIGGDYLAFASELSAIREVDSELPTGNLQAVDEFLHYNYISAPNTIYADVYKLPPASYMQVGFDGEFTRPVCYWDISFSSKEGLTDSEWEERADAIIQESVKAHLVADVPFGIFLSGGIDSTLVAMAMSRVLDYQVPAFAIGFQEERYSELKYAREVAKKCGLELHTEIVSGLSLDLLPELMRHYGEPFGDSSALPTWHVSNLARQTVPMVLSGDGGDEFFAGYYSYSQWLDAVYWQQSMADAAGFAVGMHPRAMYRCVRRGIGQLIAGGKASRLDTWKQCFATTPDLERGRLWRSEYRRLIEHYDTAFESANFHASTVDRLAYAQYMDIQTYLPGSIMPKVDVASMFHGLEVRTPLIDVRVAELAASLPRSQKLRKNKNGKATFKYLLKQMVGRSFSDSFVYRGKYGFGIPLAQWFKQGESARKLFEDIVDDKYSRLQTWFDIKEIKRLLELHDAGMDQSQLLWSLLCLGVWMQQNSQVMFQ